MKTLRRLVLILLAALATGGIYYATTRPPGKIILTGVVTTDELIVSSEVQGRMQQLFVREGDAVTNGELLAVIQPQEQLANVEFYARSQKQSAAAAAQAKADLENARLTSQREEVLYHQGTESAQAYDQARTAYDAAKARVESLDLQTQAAAAQSQRAAVQLGYTKIHAPMAGLVDTRAALSGEVVNPGQAIVTLINEDDLWVRADVEETYIDRIRVGDRLPVRLPSGVEREGTVFYRRVDADYATQRDVSRSKRDIKTFEIRLRCDNHDRRLAVGMTASVTLPVENP
jgi:RND family efflux transporter MFP subunit